MGKSFEVYDIVGCTALVSNVISDMVANGFTQKFPAQAFNAATDKIAVLEASSSIDPLAASQPWRIRFEILDDYRVQVNVATPTQIKDDGSVSLLSDGTTAGHLGLQMEEFGDSDSTYERHDLVPLSARTFIDRTYARKQVYNTKGCLTQVSNPKGVISSTNVSTSYPMSYRITTAAHGFALYIWDEASDSVGNRFSWIVVQRAVDPQTGVVYTTGKSPVYCVYSTPTIAQPYIAAWHHTDDLKSGQQQASTQYQLDYTYSSGISRFIVREADVWRPSKQADACLHTEDFRAIINPMNQVAITEDNKYVITFPNGLNTPRYAYTHELDLIATTSADVVSQWTQVPLTVYGESSARTYKSMCANGANNTGLRIMMLAVGPTTTAGTDRTLTN